MYKPTPVITLPQKIQKHPRPTSNISYTQVTQNKNTNTPKNQPHLDTTTQLTARLTTFINELQPLITSLKSLLTKVIDKVLDKKMTSIPRLITLI